MAGMRHILRQTIRQDGFTLLELVVVVLILAVVAGTIVTTFETRVMNESEITATEYEMQEIRKALLQYKIDNNSFPLNRNSPVGIDFLINDPDPSTDNDWDINYQTGWRGPYLATSQTAFVDVGDDINFFGVGDPLTINTAAIDNERAIADAYSHYAADSDDVASPGLGPDCTTIDDSDCLLEWYSDSTDSDSRIIRNGRPYLLFDLNDTSRARIVSMGSDGFYDGFNTDRCIAEGDDHVLCLY